MAEEQESETVTYQQYEKLLGVTRKMLWSFGDSREPEKTMADLILWHLREMMRSPLEKLGERKYSAKEGLKVLEQMFPLQARTFFRWKRLREAASSKGKASSDECDAAPSTVLSSNAQVAESGEEPDKSWEYEIEVAAPFDLTLGPQFRLAYQDKMTKSMVKKEYLEFCEAREVNYVKQTKTAFCKLIGLKPPFSKIPKGQLAFIGFLAWDRVGMVIELCRSKRKKEDTSPLVAAEGLAAIQALESVDSTSLEKLKSFKYVKKRKRYKKRTAKSRTKSKK